ncbi:uncharacterized protein LAESUDRAFT_723113 [Laetiporus sulphureus 93-53]|uniref:DUF6533 domain-containing protein n=1 Tax=Laetiporus sulphureus 93-53 TaxID=1314785 RepID=A0A165FST0_9APHY|nr:uncharacterized protein LAESUDRAFT_723113 [Laetiporus sulphureus 93-53]KZT09366.1 hypothetical protein LAESUDRAFT_723113 [Laetiporus sulphureus 93-53]
MADNMLNETAIIEEEFAVLRLSYVYSYCAVAIAALIFFDYAATVPQEAILVWFKPVHKFSFPSILFLLNRYLLLFMGVSLILVTFWWNTSPVSGETPSMCLLGHLRRVQQLIPPVSSALRVYAFNERRWIPALLTALLGVVPACMDIYTEMAAVHYSVLYVGKYPECYSNESISLALEQRLISAGRICSVASELIVLVSTWYKTFFCFGGGLRTRIEIGPLAKLLLRDALTTIPCRSLFVLNILEVVISARFENTEIYASDISLFIIPIESIIMSHLLLSIRQTFEDSSAGLPLFANILGSSDIEGGSIKFASRLVGNMGEDLDFDSFDRFVDEDGINEMDSPVNGEADEDAVDTSRGSGSTLSSDHEFVEESVVP